MLGSVKGSGSTPFVVGIFHGLAKPKCASDLLKDFFEEAAALQLAGLECNDIIYSIKIKAFCCDAPARALILSVKSHSGYYGCTKCQVKGIWRERVVFLETDTQLRTNDSFRKQMQAEFYLGNSILEKLEIDMVKGFPLDYMHLCFIGVMRKLLWCWIKGLLNVRIGANNVERIP